MTAESGDRIRLSIAAARELGARAVQGTGYDAEESRIIAEHVVDAAMCGYEYSGLAKILNMADSPNSRAERRPIKPLHETEVSALLDGGNNVGMLAVYRAAQIAVSKAQARSFAVVGVTHTWMSGRSAHYIELIARAGLIGIHAVSSAHQVAPYGGARAALGTNPLAFGFPRERDPLIIDMGTSAFMATDLKFRKRLNRLLPDGVAIDAQGMPTRDPAAAQLGAILPFGGHKGYALALAMDAFGILAGSAFSKDKAYGYLFIAFKPDLMIPLADYQRDLEESLARIKATPRQPGVEEIRIPSERMYRERARSERDGIVIDRAVYEALQELSRRAGGSPANTGS